MESLLNLIKAIRDSHPDMVYLYTQGQCYNFYKILKAVYPNAEAWYAQVEGHVYTKIGSLWYDIRGEHTQVPEDCKPLDELGLADLPENWGPRDRRRLIDLVSCTPTDTVWWDNSCGIPTLNSVSVSRWGKREFGVPTERESARLDHLAQQLKSMSFERAVPTALGGELKPYVGYPRVFVASKTTEVSENRRKQLTQLQNLRTLRSLGWQVCVIVTPSNEVDETQASYAHYGLSVTQVRFENPAFQPRLAGLSLFCTDEVKLHYASTGERWIFLTYPLDSDLAILLADESDAVIEKFPVQPSYRFNKFRGVHKNISSKYSPSEVWLRLSKTEPTAD